MLVEMIERSPGIWTWKSDDGLEWESSLIGGIKPKEAKSQINDKQKLKSVLKLKEAGFTTEEIIELSQAELV